MLTESRQEQKDNYQKFAEDSLYYSGKYILDQDDDYVFNISNVIRKSGFFSANILDHSFITSITSGQRVIIGEPYADNIPEDEDKFLKKYGIMVAVIDIKDGFWHERTMPTIIKIIDANKVEEHMAESYWVEPKAVPERWAA